MLYNYKYYILIIDCCSIQLKDHQMYKKIPIVQSIKNWFDKKVSAVSPATDIKENLLAPEQREIIKV